MSDVILSVDVSGGVTLDVHGPDAWLMANFVICRAPDGGWLVAKDRVGSRQTPHVISVESAIRRAKQYVRWARGGEPPPSTPEEV